MHMPNKVAADVSKWKPDPCEGPSCPYSKNMRAAQCVLGPEMMEPFDSKKYYTEKQLAQDPKKPGRAKSSDMQRKPGSYIKLEKEVRLKFDLYSFTHHLCYLYTNECDCDPIDTINDVLYAGQDYFIEMIDCFHSVEMSKGRIGFKRKLHG